MHFYIYSTELEYKIPVYVVCDTLILHPADEFKTAATQM